MLTKKMWKSKRIKILISILTLSVFFLFPVFAWNTSDANNTLISMMQEVFKFLSVAWLFLAVIAWKLMTNDFVYWSFLHLDTYLWQLRNITKNLANFVLWFLFIFNILKLFFSKDNIWDFIKKKIWAFLLAGLLIQVSWFLLWTIVDIANVWTIAVSAFPASFIQDNQKTLTDFDKTFDDLKNKYASNDSTSDNVNWSVFGWVNINIKCKDDDWKDIDCPSKTTIWIENYLDGVLTKINDLSWPFVYLWFSVFKFFDNSYANNNDLDITSFADFFTTTALNLIIVVFYSIALLLIAIINLIRILVLWVFIWLMPFIILFNVLEKFEVWGSKWVLSEFPKFLDLKNVLTLIFKPILFVAYMGFVLIISNILLWVLINSHSWNSVDLWWWIILTENENIAQTNSNTDITYNSKLDMWNLWSFTVNWLKDWLSWLIMFLVIIFLLWQLVRMSVKWTILDSFIKWTLDSVEKFAWTIPIVPIWWKNFGISTAYKWYNRQFRIVQNNNMWISLQSWNFNIKWNNAFQQNINKRLASITGMDPVLAWVDTTLNSLFTGSSFNVLNPSELWFDSSNNTVTTNSANDPNNIVNLYFKYAKAVVNYAIINEKTVDFMSNSVWWKLLSWFWQLLEKIAKDNNRNILQKALTSRFLTLKKAKTNYNNNYINLTPDDNNTNTISVSVNTSLFTPVSTSLTWDYYNKAWLFLIKINTTTTNPNAYLLTIFMDILKGNWNVHGISSSASSLQISTIKSISIKPSTN